MYLIKDSHVENVKHSSKSVRRREPNNKMDNCQNRYPTKDDIQTWNKHRRKHLTSFVMGEMQVKNYNAETTAHLVFST